ncbi:hypothetical protein H5410_022552 [Solanum commersonii]|uniref:DUF4283 domain-containing protein n=1 Tax=Solanum commersonii TaxID=4109 RepID=A0A9J5ZH38_SOLCO|nr:hypothetical protein H5410_022552 [Solanum commersonii]
MSWHEQPLMLKQWNGSLRCYGRLQNQGGTRSIKWANKGSNGHRKEGTVKRGDRICINDDASSYSEVLKKSLVGKFVTTKGELPTLADIRRWANGLWKQIHGMNIYEMGNGYFLFELSYIITAEQVVEGDWSWRNSHVLFQWWNPTICTSSTTKSARTTRIKIVDFPLQFWSQSTFKAIGDFCGGWIETEEETQLQNHLKWAKIKVKGDGSNIPREVTIDDGSLWYTMQIWIESPARVVAEKDQIQKAHLKVDTTQRSIRFIPKFKGKTCEGNENLSERSKESLTSLKTLAIQFLNAFSAWESASMENRIEPTSNSEQRENFNKQQNATIQSRVDRSLGNQVQETGESSKLPEDIDIEKFLQIQQIHDVEPVSTNMSEVRQDVEDEASQWINAHIMELNANYGVAFEGFRDETHALLMRIYERTTALENKKSENSTATPKNRGIEKYELKILQSCLNQQVERSRTKGRVLNLAFI